MRKPALIAATGLLCVLAGFAVVLIVRRWQPAGVSPRTPTDDRSDLNFTGWPAEFVTRVRSAAKQTAGPESAAAWRELGPLYHANGFAADAEHAWRTLLELEPEEARWAYFLAVLREAAGDSREAEARLAVVVRLAPDYAPAHLKFAELLFKQGRLPDAVAHYERRLQMLPGDPYARLGLARIDLEHGRDSVVVQERLEQLARDHPGFPSALNLLAELCAQAGDETRASLLRRNGQAAGRFREAEDPWLEELEHYCYDPYQLQVLGAVRMQTGRIAESLPFYEKSVRLAPNDGPAHEALGDVYLRLHRLEDARRTLEAGIAASPGTESLYQRLAQVWREQGRPSEAIAVLKRGIRALPSIAELRSDLGVALEAVGRREEAIAAYRAAVALNPALPAPQLNLGLCLLSIGQAGEARASFSRVLELHPGHTKALLALAQLELDAGNLPAAGDHAGRLHRLHPEQPEARELFALWHLRTGAAEARAGRNAEAERWFRAGLAAVPDYGELHGNLGVLHAQAGRFAEAVDEFSRFVAVAPENSRARLYLGQALTGAGRIEDARRALEQGRDLARQVHDGESAVECEKLLESLRNSNR